MSSHARLSPSNHRWVHCPGSIREEANYPDISSPAAIDGTGSHLMLEICLRHKKKAQSLCGEVIGMNHSDKPEGWSVTQERIDRVNMALNYLDRREDELKELFPDSKVNIETEKRVYPGHIFERNDYWGTTDLTIKVYSLTENKCIYVEVIDYKDGRLYVSEKDNPQLEGYMAGILNESPELKDDCRMTIIQPKTSIPIRYVDTNMIEIRKAILKLRKAAMLTDHPLAELIPDDKDGKGYCRWCKHSENCEALKESATNKIKEIVKKDEIVNNNFFDTNVEEMTPEALSELLDAETAFLEFYERAKNEAKRRINEGISVPRYRMLPGNNFKKWSLPEGEIEKILRDRKLKKSEIYISKFISVAQFLKHEKLTKLQKDKILSEYVQVVPGKPHLKKVGDDFECDATNIMFDEIVKKENKVSFY